MNDSAADPRFAGVARLYGLDALDRLRRAHVAVIGLGGVGSWAVEALARSGLGKLTLVDMDDVCVSNVNRQLHATEQTIGEPKVEVMRRRALSINPDAMVEARHAFFTEKTAAELLEPAYDCVLDAIDSFAHKVLLIAECHRLGRPIVVVGSAGGRRDAGACRADDLARTYRDSLLQMVRKRLRQKHGFPKRGDRKFHIPAVFSPEQPVYPKPDGSVCETRPEILTGKPLRLSCEQGLGAATHVTGTMGFLGAGLVIERLLNEA